MIEEVEREDRAEAGATVALAVSGKGEEGGEEKEVRGKQGAEAERPHTTNAHFSVPCSEFLPQPQSSFCIQDRDVVFNETCLARLLWQLPVSFILLWKLTTSSY